MITYIRFIQARRYLSSKKKGEHFETNVDCDSESSDEMVEDGRGLSGMSARRVDLRSCVPTCRRWPKYPRAPGAGGLSKFQVLPFDLDVPSPTRWKHDLVLLTSHSLEDILLQLSDTKGMSNSTVTRTVVTESTMKLAVLSLRCPITLAISPTSLLNTCTPPSAATRHGRRILQVCAHTGRCTPRLHS
ncbi:hypothetical protein BV25DRAFT_235617 [Artomyces pyxidatus]|uniref:Uncharacterized protein n=1 Tax=Artomyces pyxidatus TaxID=48021 RepID=A0ACB8SHS8_9AGAM|nr:hypothetical protein BV25DRAFT_235617 [Artomyces pyxidatus]